MNTLQKNAVTHAIVGLVMGGFLLIPQTVLGKGTPSPASQRCGSGRTAPPCPYYSLQVQILDNATSGGTAYGIRSDGRGDYLDGIDEVSARLPAGGMFILDTAIQANDIYRYATIDLSNPTDGTPYDGPTLDFSRKPDFRFFVASNTSSFQQMGTEGFPSTMCAYMGITFSDQTTSAWKIGFQSGTTLPTAGLRVTRVMTDSSPSDEWILTTDPSCGAVMDDAEVQVAPIVNGRVGKYISYGTFHLPLYFYLRGTRVQ